MNHPLPVDYDAVPCRRNPELHFPTTAGAQRERDDARAKNVCRTGAAGKPCPALDKCLMYAIRHRVEGVWGGTNEDERDVLRNRMGVVPVALSVFSELSRSEYRRSA